MFRICTLRVVCYTLAFVTIIATWVYYDPNLVNTILDEAELFVRAMARVIASFTNLPPLFAETIVVDRMHLDRTLVLGTLMIFWMAGLVFVMRGHTGWHVRHAIFAIFFIHVLLLVAWFGWTKETAAWYQAHADFVKTAMRNLGWYKAETVALRILQLHSLLVFAEAILVYSIVSSLFERLSLEHQDVARRLDRHALRH